MTETPKLFGLQNGDTFTITVEQYAFNFQSFFSKRSLIEIIGLEKVRLKKQIRIFGLYFSIPRLKKTWCITFQYINLQKGRWVGEYAGTTPDGEEITMFSCSQCGKYPEEFDPRNYSFCPHCGAKMEGAE